MLFMLKQYHYTVELVFYQTELIIVLHEKVLKYFQQSFHL